MHWNNRYFWSVLTICMLALCMAHVVTCAKAAIKMFKDRRYLAGIGAAAFGIVIAAMGAGMLGFTLWAMQNNIFE